MTQRTTHSRALAQKVLLRVLADGAFADRALEAELSRVALDPRDAGLVTELVYGVLRHQVYLDFLLQRLASQPLRKVPSDALIALRLGAYQLVFTRIPPHGAVNEAVGLVRQRHVRGFANAVLRKLAGQVETHTLPTPDGDARARLAVTHSLPRWLLDDVAQTLPDAELEAFAAAQNQPAPLTFRVNTTRAERDALVRSWGERPTTTLAEVPTAIVSGAGGGPGDYPGFAEGLCTVQDAAAQLVGQLAAPNPGDTVLDLCAAPGGKTTHLAELLQGRGKVVAVEVHAGKARLIRQNAERLGLLATVAPHAADATDSERLAELLHQEVSARHADLVVLDAPCSGFGTLRKHPELKRRERVDLDSLTSLQDRLLDSAAQRVKPGGTLVYAVCTVTQSEGPERVLAFLARHPTFALETPALPASYLAPLGNAQVMRTWTHRHGMDGFFAAKLLRRA